MSQTPETAVAVTEGRLSADDGTGLYYHVHGDLKTGGAPLLVPNAIYLEADLSELARDRPVVFYDLRSRGRSDTVADSARLGIRRDVEDMEAVRRHFGLERISLLGHSYLGLAVMLYAFDHPERVERIVQIGPMAPTREIVATTPRPGDDPDAMDPEAYAALIRDLQAGASEEDPRAFYRRYWDLMLPYMVGDPSRVDRVHLPPDDLPNEWIHNLYRSVGAASGASRDFDYRDAARELGVPVLTIHGTADRTAPFAGGKAWSESLPEGQLLAVEGAGHLPYAEAPEVVLPAIRRFLAGS